VIGMAMAILAAALPNAVVLRPVENLYSAPSEDSDVVTQAIYGSNVAVLDERAGWARIRMVDATAGWTPLDALQIGPPYGVSGKLAAVASLFAHIYREPDVTAHAPLLTVPFETRLEIAGGQLPERWRQARLPDGRIGWVQVGDLSFDDAPLGTPEMLALARRFLGLPYTWGGTSSFGYDCSGFMQMLERRRGILLPRDARPQAEWAGMVPVSRADLAPGDHLYFGVSPKRITHTGMYLGDGRFISATAYQTPMVRIDSLSDPHWVALLVAIRRVTGVRID
jgi:cell wall-associated NlpC family hydrolase